MIRRLVYVAFFLEVGLLLVVLPWSAFWERNYFAALWPLVRRLVTNNFVRGSISGLGVVNLVTGFAELAPLLGTHDRSEMVVTTPRQEPPTYPANPDTRVER